jgi:hypothetical protein
MRRCVVVAAVLLARAAPLLAGAPTGLGALPASVAELQDYGGCLARHQKENENVLALLTAMLARPAKKIPDLQKFADEWHGLAKAQEERFGVLEGDLVSAFADAHPNKTVHNISSLPSEYNGALEDWHGQWNWLLAEGYQAYYRIKWFQLQTRLNDEINTPVAEQAWDVFEEQTGVLEDALRGADAAVRRRDVATFERYVKGVKNAQNIAKTIKKLHHKYILEWNKFFRETKPEKTAKFVDWFNVWEVQPATWPALYALKTAMLGLAGKGFDDYTKSYKAMEKAWKPVIEAKFLSEGREFIKDFPMEKLDTEYEKAIKALSKQLYRRR